MSATSISPIIARRWPLHLLLFVITFGYIAATRVAVLAPLHTGHLAVMLLFGWCLVRTGKIHIPRTILFFSLFAAFVGVYHAIVATYFGSDPAPLLSICVSMVIYLFFGNHLARLVTRLGVPKDELGTYLIGLVAFVILTNSAVALMEAVWRPSKLFLESFLLDDSAIPYALHPFKVRGFISGAGAGLSVGDAVGVQCFAYLTWRRRLNPVVALACSTVIVAATIFIGRTGLIFGLIFLVGQFLLVLYMTADVRRSGIALLLVLSLCFAVYTLISRFEIDAGAAQWAFEWYNAVSDRSFSTGSTDALQTMLLLPEKATYLLTGIGLFEGESPIMDRSDSGYIRTVLSLGLPLAALTYGVIVGIFARTAQAFPESRRFVVGVLGLMAIVEIKEPFLYQNVTGRIVFLFAGAAMYATSGAMTRRYWWSTPVPDALAHG